MHKVIDSYLKSFATEHSIEGLEESERFERFVNYSIISKFFPDQFDIEEVSTSENDEGIDGVAALIGDDLVTSPEGAKAAFDRLRPRQQLAVHYIFCQAKRTEGFDSGDILKFGSGVARVFDDAVELNDEKLSDLRAINKIVVEKLAYVQSGRPDCSLFYACTGVWNESNNLDKYFSQSTKSIQDTGLFNIVTYNHIVHPRPLPS